MNIIATKAVKAVFFPQSTAVKVNDAHEKIILLAGTLLLPLYVYYICPLVYGSLMNNCSWSNMPRSSTTKKVHAVSFSC